MRRDCICSFSGGGVKSGWFGGVLEDSTDSGEVVSGFERGGNWVCFAFSLVPGAHDGPSNWVCFVRLARGEWRVRC